MFSNPRSEFPNLMNLRSIKPADPVLLEDTMGQWWQWPVVSLSSSLLNVSVYCGLLILSHNSVGIWGVSNVHTILIMSTQSHPRHSSTCPPPIFIPLPTPSRFLFRNPLSYAPRQSFSVLNNETAAPCPEGSTLPVLRSYISAIISGWF